MFSLTPGSRPPTGPVAATAAILGKDLTIEWRRKESVPAMVLFAVATLVVFHFALRRNALSGELAAGVLWVTLLFASILGVNRLFATERADAGLDAIILAPVDRTALFFAKSSALMIFLVALEVVALPVFFLFYFNSVPDIDKLVVLAAVVLAADLGLAVIGALIASMSIKTRAGDLMAPLLMLPLQVPVVIAAAAACGPLFASPAGLGTPAKWLILLGVYDTVFFLLAYAVFDFLVDD